MAWAASRRACPAAPLAWLAATAARPGPPASSFAARRRHLVQLLAELLRGPRRPPSGRRPCWRSAARSRPATAIGSATPAPRRAARWPDRAASRSAASTLPSRARLRFEVLRARRGAAGARSRSSWASRVRGSSGFAPLARGPWRSRRCVGLLLAPRPGSPGLRDRRVLGVRAGATSGTSRSAATRRDRGRTARRAAAGTGSAAPAGAPAAASARWRRTKRSVCCDSSSESSSSRAFASAGTGERREGRGEGERARTRSPRCPPRRPRARSRRVIGRATAASQTSADQARRPGSPPRSSAATSIGTSRREPRRGRPPPRGPSPATSQARRTIRRSHSRRRCGRRSARIASRAGSSGPLDDEPRVGGTSVAGAARDVVKARASAARPRATASGWPPGRPPQEPGASGGSARRAGPRRGSGRSTGRPGGDAPRPERVAADRRTAGPAPTSLTMALPAIATGHRLSRGTATDARRRSSARSSAAGRARRRCRC